jgi:hypothetical protein
VSGDGSFAVPGGQISFRFMEQRPVKKGHHQLHYLDPVSGFSIDTKNVAPASFNGNHAHFSGTGKSGKHKPAISFSVDVYDNSASGAGDQFFIRASNGYSAGGTLSSGNITIH